MQDSIFLAHVGDTTQEPTWDILIVGWELPAIPLIVVFVALGLYLRGVRIVNERHPRYPWPIKRRNSFLAGLFVFFLAVGSPVAFYDTTLFWVHMVQHLLLMLVAAPLLMAGGAYTLAIRASRPPLRRKVLLPLIRSRFVTVITFPFVTFLLMNAVLYATHFTSIFELALENVYIHEIEHVAYMVTACFFWWSVVGVDPSPHKLSYPTKMGYLCMEMPFMIFLGLAIMTTDNVLYQHYATVFRDWGPTPLSDQRLAGFIMWVPGGLIMLGVTLSVFSQWIQAEERRALFEESRKSTG